MLIFIFNLPTWIVIFNEAIGWDLFFTGIHPVVAVIITLRAISVKAWSLERAVILTKEGKELVGTGVIGTEMSNNSSSMSFDDVPATPNEKSNVSYRKIHSSSYVNEDELGEMVE